MPARVCVTVVTCNSRRVIGRCLESVMAQTQMPLDVIVVDNASTDGTQDVLESFRDRIHIVYNGRNAGFAAAQNQAIVMSGSEWVLTLNPDVLLTPRFVSEALAAGRSDPTVGSVCGKLLRIGAGFEPVSEALIDSTGIYFTPDLRHFDRGWSERDDGRYQETEYVFGACAAAALYRREMMRDVSVADEFFDPDFFTYREDADVAWRAQLLGWRCLYVPSAVGHHVRRVLPGRRREVPAVLNMHSVKNRFLMRIKNMTGDLYGRHWIPVTLRDVQVIAGCLCFEQTSLPAFWRLLMCLPRAVRKRRSIMVRRRISDAALAAWFTRTPATESIPDLAYR